jgi:hypothetical protein
MKFRIVKIPDLSGQKATIYTVKIEGETNTLFDNFLLENDVNYSDELDNIFDRLEMMGHYEGAKEIYFKHAEGNLGDGVCALYDSPNRKLRLYCIRYGTTAILLGGGGSKNVRALQEDPKLKHENYLLRKISEIITNALIEGDLSWSNDGKLLMGKLILDEDEY